VSAATTAPWSKAPVLLFLFPGLLLAIAGASAILSLASAANPLYVSSSGNAAVQSDLRAVERVCPYTAALQVNAFASVYGPNTTLYGTIPGTVEDRLRREDALLQQATSGLPGFLAPMHTIVGPDLAVANAGSREAGRT